MIKETMNALLVAPGMNPCEISLYRGSGFLKAAVSIGLEEVADELNFWPLSEQAGILYYRYAALWNGKINRKVDEHMFAGTFYITGVKHGRLVSLPPADMERYRRRFWEPLALTPETELDYIMAKLDALAGDAGQRYVRISGGNRYIL